MEIAYNIAVFASIVIVIYLAGFVLIKGDSSKNKWYFVTLTCAFLFLLGDLLGKTSATAEGAFLGTKIEYLGSAPLTTAVLLYVIDLCKIKTHHLFKAGLWVVPLGVIALLWTTEQHGLIYAGVDFAGNGVRHLQITPGPLHLVVHIYSFITALAALAILTHRLIKGGWGDIKRLNLFLIILGVLLPVIVNVFYVLHIIPINATPLFLSVSCILFFFNTVRYNLLDIHKLAAKMAVQSLTEAFAPVDEALKTEDLFAVEQKVLDNANKYLRELHDGAEFDIDEFECFVKEYGRLLRQLRRATRLSDRTAGNLNASRADLSVKVNSDALTGIYNRRYLDDNLERIVRAAARTGNNLCVMMIDIDYFKKYNDTYGHSMGDECLKAVATAIAGCVSRPNDFAARYGGEEFAVILPDTDERGACVMADKIIDATRALNILHEKNTAAPYITISVGITAGKVAQEHTADIYIRRADEALYQSKETGRNKYTLLGMEEKHSA